MDGVDVGGAAFVSIDKICRKGVKREGIHHRIQSVVNIIAIVNSVCTKQACYCNCY